MFAIIAIVLFLLSPFIPHFGPWPLVTLGLVAMALQLIWTVWPWRRRP